MLKQLLLLTGIAIFSTGAARGAESALFSSGDFELTAIQDAASSMRSGLFPAISVEEFRTLSGGDAAPASVNVFLLKRDGKYILVDAGNGGKRGAMLKKLGELDITPDKIDFILLTHMHGDHIGGLLDDDQQAVFPRATLYVAAPERDYWENPATGGNGSLLAVTGVRASAGRVKTVRYGDEVLPGIRAVDAAGHTPGHTVFDTGEMLIIGDLLHAAAIQFPRPELCATYDMNPDQAAASRKRIYDLAAATSRPVAGMHLPFPGVGRIQRNAERFSFVPTATVKE